MSLRDYRTLLQLSRQTRRGIRKPTRTLRRPHRRHVGGIAIYQYTGQVERFLAENGDKKVLKISLNRSPIQSWAQQGLNLITFGQFDALMKQHGYDSMFHVYALLEMDSGETFFLEKNQTILMGVAADEYYFHPKEKMELGSPNMPTALNEMLAKTRNLMGKERFFDYRPYDWNCQDFLLNFLTANGLMTEEARKFLYQDTQAIFDNLPSYYKWISKGLTDLAGIYDFITKR